MSALDGALADVNLAMLVYLVALNVAASALIAVAWVARSRAQHRHTLVEFQTISHSELTTPLSIIVPVRDEQDEVVRSVHELLDAAYPTLEVVVVNDGSQDGTLDALRQRVLARGGRARSARPPRIEPGARRVREPARSASARTRQAGGRTGRLRQRRPPLRPVSAVLPGRLVHAARP